MKRRLTALVLAVCLLCLSFAACGDDGTGGGFRFPLDAEPKGLDPQTATDTASVTVIATLFEGLTRLDADGTVVPAAADWTVSKDGKTYTFTLRDSYWSILKIKGQEDKPWAQPIPLTARDFVFAWRRAVDPNTRSPLAAEFDGIQNAKAIREGKKKASALGVKAVDDKTLRVTLEKADPTFPARVAGTPFMPCHKAFFDHTAGRYGLEQQYVLSNGAFRLAAWNHDESLLMYKHEQYHEAAAIAPEAVRYVIGTPDPVEALSTGNLDVAPLTAQQVAALGDKATTLTLQDTLRGLWFNTSVDPFTVTAVRTALRDSVEWKTLYAQLAQSSPDETPAEGFVPPDGAVTPGVPYYPDSAGAVNLKTNVKQAKQSLVKGLQVLYPEGGGRLRFELLAADDPVSADTARYLVQSWQKNLGVYPTLTLLPQADLARRVHSGNYQAALYTVTPTGLTGAENLSAFAATAAGNLCRLNNKTVDGAVTKALTGGRKQLEALEKTLWQVCPCVPISCPVRYYGLQTDATVEGITLRPFGGGRYHAPLEFRNAKKWD